MSDDKLYTHREITQEQWLRARNLTRETYDGPIYLIAGGCVIYIGEKTSDSWEGVDCPYCIETRAK